MSFSWSLHCPEIISLYVVPRELRSLHIAFHAHLNLYLDAWNLPVYTGISAIYSSWYLDPLEFLIWYLDSLEPRRWYFDLRGPSHWYLTSGHFWIDFWFYNGNSIDIKCDQDFLLHTWIAWSLSSDGCVFWSCLVAAGVFPKHHQVIFGLPIVFQLIFGFSTVSQLRLGVRTTFFVCHVKKSRHDFWRNAC